MALFRRVARALVGERITLDRDLLTAYPDLAEAKYRSGGLPPRLGGWCLRARTVAGIALHRTVWLAPDVDVTPALLLHELAHVRQWRTVPWFPARYVWRSLTAGYVDNCYECEARDFARRVGREPGAVVKLSDHRTQL